MSTDFEIQKKNYFTITLNVGFYSKDSRRQQEIIGQIT